MSAAPVAEPRPRGSRGRRWLALAALALTVAGIDRAVHPWLARRSSPLGPAAWIWTRDSLREVVPRAFFLVKDFDLESVPQAAEIGVQGDEEYVLYLNGRRIGSNAYAEGAGLDRYQVGDLLTLGGNRLAAELRSGRGVGAFLLRLEASPGGPILVVSDGTWRVLRQARPGLVAGWLGLDEAERPQVWGLPPVGRWGRPELGSLRPVQPFLDGRVARSPARARQLVSNPAAAIQATLFDWGEGTIGHLILALPPEGLPPSLLFVGETPPDPTRQGSSGLVLAPAGASSWRDAVPRRFRYALVVGPGTPPGASVEPVERELWPSLQAVMLAGPGVLGLDAPPRLPWLESEIRRRQRAEGAVEKPP